MSSGGNQRSVITTMALSVLGGAFVGGVIGAFVLPDFAAALAIGGGMAAGAVSAALFLFSGENQ